MQRRTWWRRNEAGVCSACRPSTACAPVPSGPCTAAARHGLPPMIPFIFCILKGTVSHLDTLRCIVCILKGFAFGVFVLFCCTHTYTHTDTSTRTQAHTHKHHAPLFICTRAHACKNSQAALERMVQGMAVDLAGHGITANCIAPGAIANALPPPEHRSKADGPIDSNWGLNMDGTGVRVGQESAEVLCQISCYYMVVSHTNSVKDWRCC